MRAKAGCASPRSRRRHVPNAPSQALVGWERIHIFAHAESLTVSDGDEGEIALGIAAAVHGIATA